MPTGIYKRKPLSEEHKKNLSFANKGKKRHPFSKEWKEKISKNHARYWLDKHHSKETKKKISETNKGKSAGIKNYFYGKHFKGKNHPMWKGDKHKKKGYIYIFKPNHPFCTKTGHVREHRLIVEKIIKRYLLPKEHCHHFNKIRDDNRIENLMAFVSNSAHRRFHGNSDNVKPKEIVFDGRKL